MKTSTLPNAGVEKMLKILLLLFLTTFSTLGLATPYPISRLNTPFSGSRFYMPNDSQKHTSIVMLHGSEGGSEPYVDMEANILATQGYAVLVLCYFDCNRIVSFPKQSLQNINPIIVLDAVNWLRTQSLSNDKVVVYGFSRGAELSMIVGSLSMNEKNHPNAIIAHSPSDIFVAPWNGGWYEHVCWLCRAGNNKCSETSPKTDYEWNPLCGIENNPRTIDFSKSSWVISGITISSGKRIEIEKYDGPILITVGEKDEVWPVEQSKKIEATLKGAGKKPEIHYYANEGHVFKWDAEQSRRELVLDFLSRLQ